MKTYYDILEISRYASNEVLERAHKILIKQYHPDLETDPKKKKEKEEHIKRINEAYEILSDEQKRKEYDLKVFGNIEKTNDKQYSETKENTSSNIDNQDDNIINSRKAEEMEYERVQSEYDEIINEEIKKAQQRIDEEEKVIKENLRKYEREYLRSLGYTVYEPTNWKRVGITVLIVIILMFLIWVIYLIPPIRNAINKEIDNNTAFGMIFALIKGIYSAIGSIFKK